MFCCPSPGDETQRERERERERDRERDIGGDRKRETDRDIERNRRHYYYPRHVLLPIAKEREKESGERE